MDEKYKDGIASREFNWDELDDKGKIKRMHSVIKRLSKEINCLNDTIDKLKIHEHIQREIVIPISYNIYNSRQIIKNPGDDWF